MSTFCSVRFGGTSNRRLDSAPPATAVAPLASAAVTPPASVQPSAIAGTPPIAFLTIGPSPSASPDGL